MPGIDQVRITYQIFEGSSNRSLIPGPLAETVRSVLAFHPDELRARHRALRKRLFAELGREPEQRPNSEPRRGRSRTAAGASRTASSGWPPAMTRPPSLLTHSPVLPWPTTR